jgi:hypothetical protein
MHRFAFLANSSLGYKKKSNATQTKYFSEKDVPKLPRISFPKLPYVDNRLIIIIIIIIIIICANVGSPNIYGDIGFFYLQYEDHLIHKSSMNGHCEFHVFTNHG